MKLFDTTRKTKLERHLPVSAQEAFDRTIAFAFDRNRKLDASQGAPYALELLDGRTEITEGSQIKFAHLIASPAYGNVVEYQPGRLLSVQESDELTGYLRLSFHDANDGSLMMLDFESQGPMTRILQHSAKVRANTAEQFLDNVFPETAIVREKPAKAKQDKDILDVMSDFMGKAADLLKEMADSHHHADGSCGHGHGAHKKPHAEDDHHGHHLRPAPGAAE